MRKKGSREKNNKTIDSFLHHGTQTFIGSSKANKLHPQIKVPISSGFEPFTKPQKPTFRYPNFPQFREYQFEIAKLCITYNTLVCLPTGLGKTHIASVIIANFHVWFPEGKIFFLAPTRPLVNQQSTSLSAFTSMVDKSCIQMMTGGISSKKRKKIYEGKRIFFCTPQTLENDLKEERIDASKIILIIFDEAHRAVGNYSYAKIVQYLDRSQTGYRIVALSATPGNQSQKIQEVLTNLHINKLIAKTEQDPDVKKYIKSKEIKQVIIKANSIIEQTEEILNKFIKLPLRVLAKFQLYPRFLQGGRYGLSLGHLHQIRLQIKQNISKVKYEYRSFIYQSLSFLHFLVQSKQSLKQSGYETFIKKFLYSIQNQTYIQKQAEKDDSSVAKTESQLYKAIIPSCYWKFMKESNGLTRIQELFMKETSVGAHPKLQKLKQLLVQFFTAEKRIDMNSKVIIFGQYRSTCYEIKKYLDREPIIKSELFFGQAKSYIETREGDQSITQLLQLKQKQQIKLIEKYKKNQLNTLISTSIGEEGLDIGEVDGIFCYDGGMSVIRMIQRMGRTGRKRDGSVFMLLMEGKEVDDYMKAHKKSKAVKKNMKQAKYELYGFNPSLFEECSLIPISFFEGQKKQENHSCEGNLEIVKKYLKTTNEQQDRQSSNENNSRSYSIQQKQLKVQKISLIHEQMYQSENTDFSYSQFERKHLSKEAPFEKFTQDCGSQLLNELIKQIQQDNDESAPQNQNDKIQETKSSQNYSDETKLCLAEEKKDTPKKKTIHEIIAELDSDESSSDSSNSEQFFRQLASQMEKSK